MEKIFNHEVADWIPHFFADAPTFIDGFVERPVFSDGVDAWGTKWISCPTAMGMTNPDVSDIKFTELDDWKEKVVFPDLEKIDFSPVFDQTREFDRQNNMITYISLNGIFERSHIMMGFENALIAAYEDPEEFDAMMAAFAEHKIRLLKKMYELVQPDIFLYHDDMATQKAPFLPTDFYVKHLFPHYKKIADAARTIGYKHVMHHSCGKIETLIPAWLECGFEGWESVMPVNDLPRLKKEYGDRIVFASALDAQEVLGQATATRQDIEKMIVKYLKTMAYDGTGFMFTNSILMSLNPVNEEIANEFIAKHSKAMCDAVKAGIEYVPNYEA